MKTTAIAPACLFAAGLAAAECVTVEQGAIYQPSPARVRITALVNGQPRADTQVSIFSTAGPQQRISTSTDRRGVATTPKQPAGPYQVVANGEGIEEFAAQILDPSGAPIPGTEIQVLRKGSKGEVVAKLLSDETGRFAASLPIGTYIAFARAQVFRTATMAFERVPASGFGELRIVLHIGSC